MQAKEVVDQVTMKRALTRITYEIIERNHSIQDIVLVGIKTRGIYIASRIAERLKQLEDIDIPVGELDITLYRDDKKENPEEPELHSSDIPVSLEGKEVILIDDVLYTGRTIRAAMDAVMDFGRPRKIYISSPSRSWASRIANPCRLCWEEHSNISGGRDFSRDARA